MPAASARRQCWHQWELLHKPIYRGSDIVSHADNSTMASLFYIEIITILLYNYINVSGSPRAGQGPRDLTICIDFMIEIFSSINCFHSFTSVPIGYLYFPVSHIIMQGNHKSINAFSRTIVIMMIRSWFTNIWLIWIAKLNYPQHC